MQQVMHQVLMHHTYITAEAMTTYTTIIRCIDKHGSGCLGMARYFQMYTVFIKTCHTSAQKRHFVNVAT